jgi:hypothetical protein
VLPVPRTVWEIVEQTDRAKERAEHFCLGRAADIVIRTQQRNRLDPRCGHSQELEQPDCGEGMADDHALLDDQVIQQDCQIVNEVFDCVVGQASILARPPVSTQVVRDHVVAMLEVFFVGLPG